MITNKDKDTVREALEKAKANAPACRCAEAYSSRGLCDPDCSACDFDEDMSGIDEALSLLSTSPRTFTEEEVKAMLLEVKGGVDSMNKFVVPIIAGKHGIHF